MYGCRKSWHARPCRYHGRLYNSQQGKAEKHSHVVCAAALAQVISGYSYRIRPHGPILTCPTEIYTRWIINATKSVPCLISPPLHSTFDLLKSSDDIYQIMSPRMTGTFLALVVYYHFE